MEDNTNKKQDPKLTEGNPSTGSDTKGKGNSKRGKRHGDKGGSKIPTHNDWSYYAVSEQIAKDIGNLPYNTLPAKPIDVDCEYVNSDGTVSNLTVMDASIQSVLTLNYIPSVGVGTTNDSGINMASNQLFTYIRHANSGAKVYEAPDVMMMVLAMRDIYIGMLEARRAIGTVSTYFYENTGLPRLLVKAMGYNFDDLKSNLAQYRATYNLLCAKVNSLAVPKYFKAFERSAYISSYTFSDSTSIRGQFYVFRKCGYYKWSATASEKGSSLVWTSYPSGQVSTLGGYFEIIEQQIDALLNDQDAVTMSGDILKAFGADKCYSLFECPTDYKVTPKYDEDICAQVENSHPAEVLSAWYAGHATVVADSLNVQQSNNVIIWQPKFTTTLSGADLREFSALKSFVFNSHKDNPDYKDTLEWSRMISVGSIRNLTAKQFSLDACGLEALVNYEVTFVNGNVDYTTALNIGVNTNLQSSLMYLSQFDWHPILTIAYNESMYIFGDLKKYTVIDATYVKSLHDSCNYASFYANGLY